MTTFALLVKEGRPKQWTKNLIVFAAIIFSGSLGEAALLLRTIIAFFALCALSSSVYILNDLVDLEKDRMHPKKRHRPLASGELSVGAARIGGLIAFVLGLGLATLAGIGALIGSLVYAALQLLYSFWAKHTVLLDVMVLAAGFVVRAAVGAWAIDVTISPWLLICAALLALFLALAKRRHELLLLEDEAASHRPILGEYTVPLVDEMLSMTAAATVVCYALWTFFSETAGGGEKLMLTVPFVIYGIFRYLYLVHRRNLGGSPEEILLTDFPMILNIILWLASGILVLYVL